MGSNPLWGCIELFANSILNDRKMRPLHSAFQIIRFYCRNPKVILKINFHDGLLSFKLTSAGRPAQCGQIGRHYLTGISKGHRGKWFLKSILGFYNKIKYFKWQNEEDAFFCHLKLQSHRVNNGKVSKVTLVLIILHKNIYFLQFWAFYLQR